eukprot:SAG31_NODE_43688_length_266_cov_0.616766_1_plen_88_part_11
MAETLATGEDIVLCFFFLELLVRLLGLGFRLFFRSHENVLDLIIFCCTLLGAIAIHMTLLDNSLEDDGVFSLMRMLRVSQVVRIMYKV